TVVLVSLTRVCSRGSWPTADDRRQRHRSHCFSSRVFHRSLLSNETYRTKPEAIDGARRRRGCRVKRESTRLWHMAPPWHIATLRHHGGRAHAGVETNARWRCGLVVTADTLCSFRKGYSRNRGECGVDRLNRARFVGTK